MKAKIAALIFIGSLVLARADQMIESVQQALKDQGFYYGEITGQMSLTLLPPHKQRQRRHRPARLYPGLATNLPLTE